MRRFLWALLAVTGMAAAASGGDSPKQQSTASPHAGSELPRFGPVEPARALATFETKPPFQIELVAAEPLVHDPVAMAFDADARLYVVEMCGYSEQRAEQLGAVRLLEDIGGDGIYDTSTVFADQLYWPTAVACWDGGIFVADAPDIWYLKDTNGDGKADVRRRVLTGFSHHNVQAMLNTLVWGLDNRIHCTTSTGGAQVQRAETEAGTPLTLRTRDFSWDPRTLTFAATSVGGQHGMSFDDWGRKFVCTNSNHIMQVMYDDRYIGRNPSLAAPASRILIAADGSQPDVFRISPVEPWRLLRTRMRVEGTLMQFRLEGEGRPAGYFTAASGVTIYRGDNWPTEYRGMAVVGDVGSNLIHRMQLEPAGLEFVARRTDEKSEFVASRDTWFRPVQFANGPDGYLYVADMYREIIEHPDSFGDVIKSRLHLTSGRDRGRIYRIGVERPTAGRAAGSPDRPTRLSGAATQELVKLLAHANAWHRETASRLLYERQDRAAIEPLRSLLRESTGPLGRMHALYALSGQNALETADVLRGFDDQHARVREHAVRLCESYVENAAVCSRLLTMARDPDLGVRCQVAFALGEANDPRRFAALADVARRDAGDRWLRAAVLSSLSEGAGQVFATLAADGTFRRRGDARDMLVELARLVARQNRPDALDAVVDALGSLDGDEQELAVALVRGVGQGLGGRRHVLSALLDAPGPTDGERRFRQIVSDAARIARDPTVPVAQRVDAAELLSLSTAPDAQAALLALLDNRQPPEVGEAALSVLGRSSDLDVARQVIDVWPALTPTLRAGAMELLVGRPDRVPLLLDAIEQHTIQVDDLNARQIQSLCLNQDASLRERAVRLLSPSRAGRRADVVAAYRPVLELSGDVSRGRDVFRRICAACHQAEGIGHELGPQLATFTHRGAEAILASVLDPNREVNPQYGTYTVVTLDGRVLTGLLAAETATSVTLLREEGKRDTVLRSEIEELRANGISLMPEGLEKSIDQQTMADVIAYLMALK
ncbi:MAG: PVC-type heme-binding CxxCH protein [Pirellulaceae bacterium]